MSTLSFNFTIDDRPDGHYVRVSQVMAKGDTVLLHEIGPIPDLATASKVREEQISIVRNTLEQAKARQLEHLARLRGAD